MQTITKITQILLSLLTLVLFIWVGWQGYSFLTGEQQVLVPETQAVLIIGAVIVLVGSYLVSGAVRKVGYQIAQGSKKAQLYESFLRRWLQSRNENLPLQQEAEALYPGLILLGSSSVLSKIYELEAISSQEGLQSESAGIALGSLVIAMRNELGLNTLPGTREELDHFLNKIKTYGE